MRSRLITDVLDRVMTLVAITALIGTALYVVANILIRLVFSNPLPNVTELTTSWGMILIVYFGMVRTTLRREHITVDLLADNADRSAVVLDIVNRAVAGLVLVGVSVASFAFAQQQFELGERGIVSGWPVWPTRFVIPLLLGTTGIMFIAQSLDALGDHRRGDVALTEEEGAADG